MEFLPPSIRPFLLLAVASTTVIAAPGDIGPGGAAPAADRGPLPLEVPAGVAIELTGVIGSRLRALAEHWLLPAPRANPGMLSMFRQRDRSPPPELVPWAGEFVGKYLISCAQARRLLGGPDRRLHDLLERTSDEVVRELIASQAEDGYLGPFPRPQRLLGNWDLWGHEHAILGLLASGPSPEGLAACRRAADLICRTYLDGGRRVFDAGSHEMNMAVIHTLAELHRRTGEERYLRMAREIEKDWERAGDYLRTGLAGVEFFRTPRPRWESLHDLQGLVSLYRVTGDERYRRAFEHHWRSIQRFDRRNSGGFSSGEQATGDPYAPTAIETCCTVAWEEITLDFLRLTGDPRAADELELSLYNSAAGAIHPSGRWCTYSTPMDGAREASAQAIVFQARAGTPELNCCSVNGPRGIGILSRWAVMVSPDGALAVNSYEPAVVTLPAADLRDGGGAVTLRISGDSPAGGRVRIEVAQSSPRPLAMRLRIPAWSRRTTGKLEGIPLEGFRPGEYFSVTLPARERTMVELDLDFSLRAVAGAKEAAGRVSLYRGPILLAYDQRWNGFDEESIPPLSLDALGGARLVEVPSSRPLPPEGANELLPRPWLLVEVPAAGGRKVILSDFATAGATGTRYRSWLVSKDPPPPPSVTLAPADGAAIPAEGTTLVRWSGPRRVGRGEGGSSGAHGGVAEYRLLIAADEKSEVGGRKSEVGGGSGFAPGDFTAPLQRFDGLLENRFLLDAAAKRALPRGAWLELRVDTVNARGVTVSESLPARVRIDLSLPPGRDALPEEMVGPDGILLRASLAGKAEAEFGALAAALKFTAAEGPSGKVAGAVELRGPRAMLVYSLPEFPEESYTASVRVRIEKLPEKGIAQVFSAWAGPSDDPLRIVIEGGKVFARIEAGAGFSTPGFPIEPGQWRHLAAVKEETQLRLYVDGKERGACAVPAAIATRSHDVAIGGNPHFEGDESLPGRYAELEFYARALTAAEVRARGSSKPAGKN